jgi:two-component system LytT family sensor kinase
MIRIKSIILRHIFVWIIFITYEVIYVKFAAGVTASLLHILIFYILNIGLFYFNANVVLDFAFFKTAKPYFTAITLILLELVSYLFCKFFLDYMLSTSPASLLMQLGKDKSYLLINAWRGIYFIGFSIAYWSMCYMLRFKERNHLMETQQLKSMADKLELENKYISVENAYLQNQISPHLLFNSLSFIHNEVYKVSAEAGNSVARLSDLMRYSLVSADDTRSVLLSEETGQLENLIELCRMRFTEQFFLRFNKKGKLSTVQIIPLVLVTLVENVMKHGDMGEKKHPAHIKLELEGTQLKFETRNLKRNTNLYPKGGLGLKNIEKRLSNYYQDRYQLLIDDEEELFTINLIIDL